MMTAYDLSYSVAHQHINDLRREAAARRLLPGRAARPRTLRRFSRAQWPWVAAVGPETC